MPQTQNTPMLDEDILQQAIEKATPTEKLRLLAIVQELDQRRKKEKARVSFMAFVEHVWPEFIHGSHHRRMADIFERVARGEAKRVIINLAPRHTKSEFASFLFPAWFLGLYPHKQVMQLSHTADLAEQFGRKVRNLVDSDAYHDIFPDTKLRKDSTAAARWNTDKNGIYQAMGVGAAVAGKGADLCLAKESIIDNGRRIQIKDIQTGDVIRTNNGWEKVTNKSLTIHDSHVVINQDVKASKTHPFMTNRGWVEADDLCIGDKILTTTIWRRLCIFLKTLLKKRGKG